MPDTTASFDALLNTLDTVLDSKPPTDRPPDAIDRILTAPTRASRVRTLRDDPIVARLRQDLTNGLIRVDTANAVFRLLARVLDGIASA